MQIMNGTIRTRRMGAVVVTLLATVTLAACETAPNGRMVLTDDGQRAAIGAAGLGVAAALTDNDVGTAVAIGAAGGALCDDVRACR